MIRKDAQGVGSGTEVGLDNSCTAFGTRIALFSGLLFYFPTRASAREPGDLQAVKTENPREPNQVGAAIQACVEGAIKAERPFRHVNDFLLMLKRAKWTEAEVLEVQNGVLAALKQRRDPRNPTRFR